MSRIIKETRKCKNSRCTIGVYPESFDAQDVKDVLKILDVLDQETSAFSVTGPRFWEMTGLDYSPFSMEELVAENLEMIQIQVESIRGFDDSQRMDFKSFELNKMNLTINSHKKFVKHLENPRKLTSSNYQKMVERARTTFALLIHDEIHNGRFEVSSETSTLEDPSLNKSIKHLMWLNLTAGD